MLWLNKPVETESVQGWTVLHAPPQPEELGGPFRVHKVPNPKPKKRVSLKKELPLLP